MEVEALETSPLVGTPLGEVSFLKMSSLALVRDGEVIIAQAYDSGCDRVTSPAAHAVKSEKMFSVRLRVL